jgi:excisionase family DNA binding protein
MKTLGIKEAAELIKVHPVTLYRMAARGEIPASKPAKRWCFVEIDLIEWLRAQYSTQASVSDSRERSNVCHSTNVKIQTFGGMNSQTQQVKEYKKALGLL